MRLGGSTGELKIDPNRVQEQIKNDLEGDKTTRSEKKGIKSDKRRPKKLQRAQRAERLRPLWPIWSPKMSPKSPPRAPKRSPREAQNALKTIFESKSLIFPKFEERLS